MHAFTDYQSSQISPTRWGQHHQGLRHRTYPPKAVDAGEIWCTPTR